MSNNVQHDNVNHPAHYTSHPGGVECVDIAEHLSFNLGNALKYVWRAGKKNPEKTREDLEKARWYMNREITLLERDPQHFTVLNPSFVRILAQKALVAVFGQLPARNMFAVISGQPVDVLNEFLIVLVEVHTNPLVPAGRFLDKLAEILDRALAA